MEIFKKPSFILGFILGILFLTFVVYTTINTGFNGVFIFVYFCIFVGTILTAEELESTFEFFIGLGVPYLLIVLLIFFITDQRNKKKDE